MTNNQTKYIMDIIRQMTDIIDSIKGEYPKCSIILNEVNQDAGTCFHAHLVDAPIIEIETITEKMEALKKVSMFTKFTVSPCSIVMQPEDLIGRTVYSTFK